MKFLQVGSLLITSSFLLFGLNANAKSLTFDDPICKIKVLGWEKLKETANRDDALFVGNVEFSIESKSFKADELFVKNFRVRSNCFAKVKGAHVVAYKPIK